MNTHTQSPLVRRIGALLCLGIAGPLLVEAAADMDAVGFQFFPVALQEEVKSTDRSTRITKADIQPPIRRLPGIAACEQVGIGSECGALAARRTHFLWGPFSTANAATGFAHRLTEVSGVDIRVSRVAPGRYRVGFEYGDQLERNWYLGQIQARTGLEMDNARLHVDETHALASVDATGEHDLESLKGEL